MSWRAVVAGVLVAASIGGCGDKKKKVAEQAPPPPVPDAAPPPVVGPSAPLWALAPPDAVAGLVVAPGALGVLVGAWDRARELAGQESYVGGQLDRVAATLTAALGVDLADSQARAASGVDLARGAALFTDDRGELVLVVAPWPSAEAMASAVGGGPSDAGPGLYTGSGGTLVCMDADGRVLCAPTGEAIERARTSAVRPLQTAASGRDPELLGDVELIIDIERIGVFDEVRDRLAPLISPVGRLAAVVDLEPGQARVRAHLLGRPSPAVADLLRDPTSIPRFAARDRASATALRFRIDPGRLEGQAAALGIDSALLSAFTGDVALYGRGSGVLAGEVLLGLADPARARAAIGPLCNSILLPFGPIEKLDDKSCRVSLKPGPGLAASPAGQSFLEMVTGTPLAIELDGRALVISIGAPTGIAPVTPAAAGPWQLSWRARNLDPFTTADDAVAGALGELVAQLPDDSRRLIAGLRWLAWQLAEVALGVRIASDGLHAEVSAAFFSGDPPAAFAAYRVALERLSSGDRAGYRAAISAAAAAHPNSRLADQAELVRGGSPTVGPSSLAAAVLLPALMRFAREARAGRDRPSQR